VRTAFLGALLEVAARNDRVWLLCGDLGYSVLEPFAQRFPDRYVNVGVAEQNMTGVAAGLALSNKIVFTYSIGNFPVIRCLEQIRNDVCYHNLNVKVVAVGGGMAYGAQGYSHHAIEDLAVTCVLPNMTVVAPGDPVEAAAATRAIADRPGPCYLRLGKAGERVLHATAPAFEIGRAITMQDGIDVTLISTGGLLEMALMVAADLAKQAVSARVLSMPTVQPIDAAAIVAAMADTGRILTLEEHGRGGLGSAVAEVIAESGIAVKFRQVKLQSAPSSVAGSQAALRAAHGISVEHVSRLARAML
jgi:transketolase